MSQDFRKKPDPRCSWCRGTGTVLAVDDGMVAEAPCACTDVFPEDTPIKALRRWWARFTYHLAVVHRAGKAEDEYPF